MIVESMIRRVGAGFCRCFDLDPRIRALVIFYAVAQQICKKLANSVAVAPDVRQRRLDAQLGVLAAEKLAQIGLDHGDQLVQIDHAEFADHLAGAREMKQCR